MDIDNKLDFVCPKCGTLARNHYGVQEFGQYVHDSLLLTCGALWCGNCENGVDTSKDDYGSPKPTKPDDDGELFATGHA